MAVTKLWAVKSNLKRVIDYAANPEKTANPNYTEEQFQALADVLRYAKDEEKTERQFYCEGINCNPQTARDQFVTVKEQFDKTDGIQAYHGYLSFKETDITPEKAQEIGMEFAQRVWGENFQVVVTTHLNTKHLHCHFVINSVSFKDGKRCHDTQWFKFRKIADEICEQHHIYYDPQPNRSTQSSYYRAKEIAGVPTRYSMLKEAIDEAISHSSSLAEFDYALREMGYAHQLSPTRKYWTVVPKGYEKPVRLANLGEEYTNEAIIERLKANRGRINLEPFQRATVKVQAYKLPTRGDRIKKVGGLYGLYLYYCYRLGYLPKYKKQNTTRLHYLLKEDLAKLDNLTAEVTLLGRNHIENSEQLFSFKAHNEDEIKRVEADRTHLRTKLKRKLDDAELSAVKQQISELTGILRTLKKEVKMCDSIAERSKVMEQNLERIKADEEKSKGKEKTDYDKRR